MSENNSGWKQGNVNGPNEKLLELAEKLATVAKIGLQERVKRMQAHVTAEAKKFNHPVLNDLVKKINDIKVV